MAELVVVLSAVTTLLPAQKSAPGNPQASNVARRELWKFAGGLTDGASPTALIEYGGSLYGITDDGGTVSCGYEGGCGTIFELSSGGQETLLYSFCQLSNCADGLVPTGIISDAEGNIYGTTAYGGSSPYGTIFELPKGGTETVLANFTGFNGTTPEGGVISDSQGNLYGTTLYGGKYFGSASQPCFGPSEAGCGTIFELPKGGEETVLYNFCSQSNCTDGELPNAGLIRDQQGNLYGTAEGGSASECGVVFKLAANGTYSVIYTFAGGTDGCGPEVGLTADGKGNLFGTTGGGGLNNAGTVFELTLSNGQWTETPIYGFTNALNGQAPNQVVFDASGNLWGTTRFGGSENVGAIFELTQSGNVWTESFHESFTGKSDGSQPSAAFLFLGPNHLYGTTLYGGNISCSLSSNPEFSNEGCGTIFEITEK